MINLEEMREKLQDQINYHNVLYHQKNKPEISDAEYDELKKKLAEIEVQFMQHKVVLVLHLMRDFLRWNTKNLCFLLKMLMMNKV